MLLHTGQSVQIKLFIAFSVLEKIGLVLVCEGKVLKTTDKVVLGIVEFFDKRVHGCILSLVTRL